MKKKTKIIIWVVVILLIIVGYVWIKDEESSEPLIGGCGSVHPYYISECCQRLADDGEIVQAECIGHWEISEGVCSWICDSEDCDGLLEEDCEKNAFCIPQYVDEVYESCEHVTY